ncbi:heterogeneous nuclear ribonucleoprotein 27C isoform X2 [Cydia amplana]|uniref:heterogeneous nuclear ribonucleoprotein 27C isoform X2 n=1 Tax=Cydia amplana TaxID=1869771 RepID=UPI002FE593B8
MRMNPDMDDDEKGKLFVGGLSWETSQENLQRYFSRYGDVIDCVVMKNSESGRSRGFGFVTFAEPSLVNVVLQNGPHQLDGRTIDPKPCNPRTLQKPKRGGGYPKVFLGGLPSNITETDLRVFFGRYGKVMEVVIMYDQEKKKSRGFGFLSFEEEMSVERVTQEHFINLNGKQVEIKRAEPRDGSGKLGSGGLSAPGDAPAAGQWGPPAAAPLNMIQGHNGQMPGPPINMPMAGPNIMQGYQGWGTSPGQTSYAGYGAAGGAAGPGSYQGWGAPPQQAPPHQPAWPANNNYSQHQQPPQQGYGSYGSYVPLSEGGEMYGRSGGGGAPALAGALSSAAALSKSSSADYSSYQQYPPAYQQDQVH